MSSIAWMTPVWSSSVYALWSVVRRLPVTDGVLRTALEPEAERLRGLPLSDQFWCRLVTQIARYSAAESAGSLAMIVESVISQATASGPLAGEPCRVGSQELADVLHAAHTRFQGQRPHLQRDLPLRIAPLRDQWLARGPGFVRQLTRRQPSTSAHPPLELVAVEPICGGFGTFISSQPSALIEALLTNANDDLPEVARLAWLVAQAEIFRRADEQLTRPFELRMASLLITLAIAQELDWFAAVQPPLQLAVEMWLDGQNARAQECVLRLPPHWYRDLASDLSAESLLQWICGPEN